VNLHGIVSGHVSAVNPWVLVSIQRSTGYTTDSSGHRIPAYASPEYIKAQVQALQYNDIAQVDGLNIQGERRAMYLDGNWDGIQRADGKGGDIITMPDGTRWLVAMVLENWASVDGWVKVACTRQL
jgi:hypothetical protein